MPGDQRLAVTPSALTLDLCPLLATVRLQCQSSIKPVNQAMARPGPRLPETSGSTHFRRTIDDFQNGDAAWEVPIINEADPFLDVVKKLSKYVYIPLAVPLSQHASQAYPFHGQEVRSALAVYNGHSERIYCI